LSYGAGRGWAAWRRVRLRPATIGLEPALPGPVRGI
jgi:hypothetical protein